MEHNASLRQDMKSEGAGAIECNRRYYKFLGDCIGVHNSNILQENLLINLSSLELIALLPCHCECLLATFTTHILGLLDLLLCWLGKLLIHFMIFWCKLNQMASHFWIPYVSNDVSQLTEHLESISHGTLGVHVLSNIKEDNSMVLQFDELNAELMMRTFQIWTCQEDGSQGSKLLLMELWNPTKATSNYLCSVHGKFNWEKKANGEDWLEYERWHKWYSRSPFATVTKLLQTFK